VDFDVSSCYYTQNLPIGALIGRNNSNIIVNIYMLYCFTSSVKHLKLSVIVIIFVHIRYIFMHVGLLKMLEALDYFDVYIFKITFQVTFPRIFMCLLFIYYERLII